MYDLIALDPALPGALTVAEIGATMAYAEAEKSEATRRSYESDWCDHRLVRRPRRHAAPSPCRHRRCLPTHDIAQMLDLCPDTMIGKRTGPAIAFGFAGAFRRSELCARRRRSGRGAGRAARADPAQQDRPDRGGG